jgi:hypothetical protein
MTQTIVLGAGTVGVSTALVWCSMAHPSEGATTDATFKTLGVHASTGFNLGGIRAAARGTLGWRHAFGNSTPKSTLSFAGGSPFSIAGRAHRHGRGSDRGGPRFLGLP